MTIQTGISETGRETVANGLAKLLADSYTLYLKTQNFHWNVTGPQFQSLHSLFEQQYTELATAIDEIAERIRALGHRAPGSYSEFGKLSSLNEAEGTPTATEMVQSLLKDNEQVIGLARSLYGSVEEAKDDVSADLLTARISVHEKAAWMLRSSL